MGLFPHLVGNDVGYRGVISFQTRRRLSLAFKKIEDGFAIGRKVSANLVLNSGKPSVLLPAKIEQCLITTGVLLDTKNFIITFQFSAGIMNPTLCWAAE